MPSGPEIRFVAARIAAGVLEAAASQGHQETLERAVRSWFPDPSRVDHIELKQIVGSVRTELELTRASIMNRLDRWVAEGKAEPL